MVCFLVRIPSRQSLRAPGLGARLRRVVREMLASGSAHPTQPTPGSHAPPHLLTQTLNSHPDPSLAVTYLGLLAHLESVGQPPEVGQLVRALEPDIQVPQARTRPRRDGPCQDSQDSQDKRSCMLDLGGGGVVGCGYTPEFGLHVHGWS